MRKDAYFISCTVSGFVLVFFSMNPVMLHDVRRC